jgi:hypothetical protein
MIAIRPPEYFPRLAYTGLLMHVDHFVLADTFQYSKQTFQNRSKLRNPNGWQWITVPLFHQHGRAIQEAVIDENDRRWRERHWRAFMYNYRSTMYFEFFEDTFQPFFERDWERLGPCTCRSVELTAELLDIETRITRASALDGQPDTVANILTTVGADTLVAPEGVAAHDADAAPEVQVYRFEHPTYRQNFEGFEPDMSAMDAVFNYGPDARRLIREGGRAPEPLSQKDKSGGDKS